MSSTPHLALYRRWRAQTFGQIVGQQPIVETLRNAVRTGRTVHAYLFVGPRGTGKTSLARILAKAVNCPNVVDGEPCDACPACVSIREGTSLDVAEFDAASNNTVGDMRDLLPRVATAPSDLRRKVFIVDEVQRITQGWDVLLKTLEEPPDHVIFIFCTTDSSQIRPAVLSRVQRFDFRRLTVEEIAGKLRTILAADGRTAEPEAVELVARLAAGGMRDAESMLDQLLSSGDATITAADVRDLLGLAGSETVEAFAGALVRGDAVGGVAILARLDEQGRDLRSFTEQVVDWLRDQLLASLTGTGSVPSDPSAVAEAARRLAAVDPSRPGPGGLRFQLELALFAGAPGPTGAATSRSTERAAAATAAPPIDAAARPATTAARPSPNAKRAAPVAPDTPAATSGTPADAPAPAGPGAVAPQGRPNVPAPAVRSPAPAARGASAEAPPLPEFAPAEARAAAAPTPPAPASAGTSPAATAADAGSRGPGPTLAELQAHWPEVVALVSRHPPSKPVVEACRPIEVEGTVITLGFPEGQSFFRELAERRRGILEEGLTRVLGVGVAVRFVATNLDPLPPAVDPEAGRLLAEAKRIFADDLADVGEVE